MPKEKQKPRRLTGKQKVFVEVYLETLNATEATRRAGYKGNGKTLRSIGSENLTKPNIKWHIEQRVKDRVMAADEVLDRIGAQARGNIGLFVQDYGGIDPKKVIEFGHLVESYSVTKNGISIKMHNSQRALELLGKYHQLFTDRVKHEGDINLIWDLTVPAKT